MWCIRRVRKYVVMYVRRVHITYVASAFSVSGTLQIVAPSRSNTQGVPLSVARLYLQRVLGLGLAAHGIPRANSLPVKHTRAERLVMMSPNVI